MTQQIKVSELFYSIQGEGRYMGVPSVFLRTFGCNFTCDGFGMVKGKLSDERNVIASNIDRYTEYRSLPLVSTGCDSYASWDPRFKDFSPVVETDGIAKDIINLLPHKHWESEHLVITGGEPLLGWQRSYPDLLSHKNMAGLKEITFETNGSQKLTDEFYNYLDNEWLGSIRQPDQLTFSVSAKLSSSGEKREDAINPDIIVQYESLGYTYLKFVVSTQDDIDEVLEVKELYRDAGFEGPVYIMPVGGVESVYTMNNRKVADFAMKYGLRYSDRLQVPLFKNAWAT